ncbi:MAG: hypothetical protein Q7S88_02275 [Candidatus Daviesbacteria bacterium]|nr:hypothetical protein [Candidatus Daviesbacteria bacterium]
MALREFQSLTDQVLDRAVEFGTQNLSLIRERDFAGALAADKDKDEALIVYERLLEIQAEVEGYAGRFHLTPLLDQTTFDRPGMFMVGRDPDRVPLIDDRESSLDSIDKTDDDLYFSAKRDKNTGFPRVEVVLEPAPKIGSSPDVIADAQTIGSSPDVIADAQTIESSPVSSLSSEIESSPDVIVDAQTIKVPQSEPVIIKPEKKRMTFHLSSLQRAVMEALLVGDEEGITYRYPRLVDVSRQLYGDKFRVKGLSGQALNIAFNSIGGSIITARIEIINKALEKAKNPHHPSDEEFDEFFQAITQGNNAAIGVVDRAARRKITFAQFQEKFRLVTGVEFSLPPKATQDSGVELLNGVQEEGLDMATTAVTVPFLDSDSSNGNGASKPQEELNISSDQLNFTWPEMLLLARDLIGVGVDDDEEKRFLVSCFGNLRANSGVVSLSENPETVLRLEKKLGLLNGPKGKEMVRLIDNPQIQAVLAIYDRLRSDSISPEPSEVVSPPPVEVTTPIGRTTLLPPRIVPQHRRREANMTKDGPPELTTAEKLVLVAGILKLKPHQLRERGIDLTPEDYALLRSMDHHYRTDPKVRGAFNVAQRTVSGKVREIRFGLDLGIISKEDLPEDLRRIVHIISPKKAQVEVGKI